MSILSSVRFFVDVYQLPLSKLIANILKTYQVVFHTCVDVLLIWLPYKLPPWGKDLLIFYSLFAFIYLRVLSIQPTTAIPGSCCITTRTANCYMYSEWGSDHHSHSHLARPYSNAIFSAIFHHSRGGHGPSQLYFSKDRPIEGLWRGIYFGDARIMMALRLAAIVLGSLVVMLFNYALQHMNQLV